jgi:cyanate lyase
MRILQNETAAILGISPSFLCEVYKGKRRFSTTTARRISELLSLDIMILLYGKPMEIKSSIEGKIPVFLHY